MSELQYVNYFSLKEDKVKVEELYINAFPEDERCPFDILLSRVKKHKGDFYAFYNEEEFVGLIYNVVYKDIVYIYYLAITEPLRNKGYGTKVLNDMKEMYKDKRIILMAETLDPSFENYEQRLNRSKFYSKNGFNYQGYTIKEFGVVYDMLGNTLPGVKKIEFKKLFRNYCGFIAYHRVYKKNTDIEENL